MKKSRFILLVVVAFLIGAIISSVVTSFIWERFMNRFAAISAAGTVSMNLATLQCLQTGDTNHAAELLNMSFNSEVISVGGFVENNASLRHEPMLLGVLLRARDYRAKHPYEESPTGRMLIEHAFELVGEQTGQTNKP